MLTQENLITSVVSVILTFIVSAILIPEINGNTSLWWILSTIITCVILFWFGMSFGASIIQGFALTLFIGVVISMFTAITVSRTFLHVVIDSGLIQDLRWYGLAGKDATPASGEAAAPKGVTRV